MAADTIAVRSALGVGRLPAAAESLARLLAERRAEPFAWGRFDCCLFAADAVAAQTGVDPAAGLRGRYATELQAQRVLAALDGLEGIARAALGEPLRHPALACAGDMGLTAAPGDRTTLSVCLGEWWAMPGAAGLVLRPMSAALMSWRVGCA